EEEEWCTPQMMDSLIGGYLVLNIQRVEKLTFIIDNMSIVDEIQSRLSTISAPILKQFKVVLGELSILLPIHVDDPCTELDESLPFFGGAYPQLQSLTLHWVPLNYISGNLANLTELDFSLQDPLPPSLFIKFITPMSQLRSLALRNGGPAFEARDQHSQVVHLPSLRRLVLGAMHAQYIEYLLSIFRLPALQELGVHAIYENMAEDVWRCLAKYERRHLLSGIQTLELFDVEESLLMQPGLPSSFVLFLSTLHRLKYLCMRKVALGFLQVLQAPVNLHLLPTLEALEICCVVKRELIYDWDDIDDRFPVETDIVADNLVRMIRERSVRRRLPILHLDKGEWRPEKRARFLRLLAEDNCFNLPFEFNPSIEHHLPKLLERPEDSRVGNSYEKSAWPWSRFTGRRPQVRNMPQRGEADFTILAVDGDDIFRLDEPCAYTVVALGVQFLHEFLS
ncbi:10579_t:CDS:2, partial [Acaulospora colombiana]